VASLGRSKVAILTALKTDAKSYFSKLLWEEKTSNYYLLQILMEESYRQGVLSEYVRLISRLGGFVSFTEELKVALRTLLKLNEVQLDTLISTDLDNYAEIWDFTRLPGVKAMQTWALVFSTADPVFASLAWKVKTLDGFEYKLVESLSGVVPTLVDGKYLIYAMMEAAEVGTAYNLPSGTTASGDLTNFREAWPLDHITSGQDVETDVAFVNRIRLLRRSRGVGSKSFLLNMMLEEIFVYDAKVYSANDGETYFDRASGADVWVYADEVPNNETDTIFEQPHPLSSAPLINENPIVTSGFVLIKDTGDKNRSVFEVNTVVGDGSETTVEYQIDQSIQTLQDKLEDPDYWGLGGRGEILVKKAYRVKIDILLRWRILAGYTRTTVDAVIAADLLKFFTGGIASDGSVYTRRLIGVSVSKSDILEVVLRVDGVDDVDLSTLVIMRADNAYSGIDPMPVDWNEYSALGVVTLSEWT